MSYEHEQTIEKTVQLQGTSGYSHIMCEREERLVSKCPSCPAIPNCFKFNLKDRMSWHDSLNGVTHEVVVYTPKYPTAILFNPQTK